MPAWATQPISCIAPSRRRAHVHVAAVIPCAGGRETVPEVIDLLRVDGVGVDGRRG